MPTFYSGARIPLLIMSWTEFQKVPEFLPFLFFNYISFRTPEIILCFVLLFYFISFYLFTFFYFFMIFLFSFFFVISLTGHGYQYQDYHYNSYHQLMFGGEKGSCTSPSQKGDQGQASTSQSNRSKSRTSAGKTLPKKVRVKI